MLSVSHPPFTGKIPFLHAVFSFSLDFLELSPFFLYFLFHVKSSKQTVQGLELNYLHDKLLPADRIKSGRTVLPDGIRSLELIWSNLIIPDLDAALPSEQHNSSSSDFIQLSTPPTHTHTF